MDADEAFGLSDPVALDQVFEDGDRLLRRQTRVEQGRALAFGEAALARLAVEQADVVVFAYPCEHAEMIFL